MKSGDIAFPNLGLYLDWVPRSFSIFGFTIAWYGVLIGIGALAGFLLALSQAKKENVDTELIWDFVIYALFFSIVGARIYYVVFSWDTFKDNPINIFKIREGGLAIFGAVIAAFLTCYIFTRIKKISFLRFADVCIPGLILGQAIGRWGNFTNREVFGRYSDGLFCMRLPVQDIRSVDISPELALHIIQDGVDYVQVHPTFLYECVLNLCVLACMLLYRKHKKFDGEMCLLYLGGYGIVRFFIEGIRTDRLTWGHTNIAVSQVLGMLLFIFAVFTDIFVRVMQARKKALAILAADGDVVDEVDEETAETEEEEADVKAAETGEGEES